MKCAPISFSILFKKLRPFILPEWKARFYLIIGFFFVILGGHIYSESASMIFLEFEYSQICQLQSTCSMPSFTLTHPIAPSLFFMYRINNFYQNDFIYMSTVPAQTPPVSGVSLTNSSNCNNYLTNGNMQKTVSVTNTSLEPNEVAVPCGFASFMIFNDTFSLISISDNQTFQANNSGIAWESDLSLKFANYDLAKQWINLEFEPFINWARVSPFSEFLKTWGKIDQSLKSGQYLVQVENHWDESSFKGTKSVILAEATFFGTKNEFLGIVLMIGGIWGMFAGYFSEVIIKHRQKINSEWNIN